MELIIKELEPTICLNMIVKNESHIIEDTLNMLCSKINFSYWVICDTGSTDNTCDIITHFFQSKHIQGELHNHEWKNFAHNRTLALQAAFNKTDLLFVFDADDEICGQLNMPTTVDSDGYMLNFGHATGISYQRMLLVNNRIHWEYKSVIHEYIHCLKPNSTLTTIEGDYYIVSGRRGHRSSDVNKYLKDALILEEAYAEAKQNGDDLHMRYAFYCANSYKDCGKHEDAIKWYKVTLTQDNWSQEKYMCCLNLYNEYNAIGETEKGIFYLVESFKYDTERMECVYILIKHYLLNGLPNVAYKYYENVKEFYEGKYLTTNNNGKLFVEPDKANFFLPYYMILVCDKVKDRVPSSYQTIVKMFEIIFTKKYIAVGDFYLGNTLFNLQFFIEKFVSICSNFTELFQSYIDYLETNNIDLSNYDFFKKFEPYGISRKVKTSIKSMFSEDDCKKSNKILIYTGFSNIPWNYTYSLHNSLGGSESAVINLANSFPKSYDIYIGGAVAEEIVDNITYVNLTTLKTLVKTIPLHTVIVSRYVAFYEMFNEVSFFQSYIWGHDINLFNYGCNLDVGSILTKWSSRISGCVCQTEWHKNLFESHYPELKGKIATINNGIQIDKFVSKNVKTTNRFVYTSCSERGLDRLLELWPQIIESLPDAELFIASYNKFPHNDYEHKLNDIIKKQDSITHVGSLNKDNLYKLMSSAEFWLYPTNFNETSCITAMEMLMSEVICVYYPLAGLINTLGDYGIPVERGNEIDTIINLSLKKKYEIRKRGLTYASSCSWNNRMKEWITIIDKFSSTNMNETNTENFIIKIINLETRTDRKEAMISKLTKEKVSNYQFFKAVNGFELEQSQYLYELLKNNDFGYKKGVIGCTLSHIHLWNELLHDDAHPFYVILEDDVTLCSNFKNHLNFVSNIFVSQNIEHLALGEYSSNKNYPINSYSISTYKKNLYEEVHITFGYLISKKAVIKIFDYINSCSIKCAIDNPQAFGYIVDYNALSHKLVECKIDNQYGSDIQQNMLNNTFTFTNTINKSVLTIAYCDWWESEYCGGIFDVNDNFITNLLKTYNGCELDVKVVNPTETPDILFYSIFGTSHKSLKSNRKIFFSGEPFGQDLEANYNITFDDNNLNNARVPLWLFYFDENIYHESIRRMRGITTIPVKEKFCSFIASGPGLTNNRKELVDKLSTYKTVDCGGTYLNNLGGTIPVGLNCSGKIEHNNKYKFAMAFESKCYPGYVTEKICDIFKSNAVPIYWGTSEVVRDFNPKTFINANSFVNFDELVEYIKKVDTNDDLYNSYFKEPILSTMWIDIFSDKNSTFFKNLVDKIVGKSQNLLNNYLNPPNIHSHNYKFEYGSEIIKTDVTDIVMTIGNTNGFIEIPVSDESRADIFGDPCWGVVKNMYITEFNNMEIEIVPPHKCKFINLKHEKYLEKDYKFIMGFYDNSLCERGTTTALYSYAEYAETYFQCKSIIFYNICHHSNDTDVIRQFHNRFLVYGVENFDQIDNIISTNNIKYFYNICGGKPNSTTLVKNCKNLIHAVFDIEPFGDIYSAVSDYIIMKSKHSFLKAIPHMVNLPKHNDNMRIELNIPSNCFVLGRYGGFNQFDVTTAHNAIQTILQTNNDLFFLFANTAIFYEHPRIIYLNKIIDPKLKVKFINTCDCMIHARSDGETFGLAIAEFSTLNKPIITCRSLVDNCHIDILGENGIIFDSEESLITILNNIRTIKNSKQDWNMYKKYNPFYVMTQFHNVFLPDEEFITNDTILNYKDISYFDMNNHNHNAFYKNDNAKLVIVTAFLDINRDAWNKYNKSTQQYVDAFYNYFNYDNYMVAFIDDRYINEVLNKYVNAKYKKTKFIPINVKWMEDNIYAWKQLLKSTNIMKSQEYVTLVKSRIDAGCPENMYAEYNAINHSKVDFINYAINLNHASVNDIICWSDFGYFNSVFHNNCNEYPTFSLDKHKISPTHLSFFLRNKLDKDDENIMHTLLNAPEKFTGSFFAGPGNLMLELQTLVHSSLDELHAKHITDDDQHIYLRCYLKNHDIFHLYINENEWPKSLCFLQKTYTDFELIPIPNNLNQVDNNVLIAQNDTTTCNPLFIVTSYINEKSTNTIFTQNERYLQTLQTIDTIKIAYPDSVIIVVEGSDYKYNNQLYNTYDKLHIYYLQTNISAISKSIGEATLLKDILTSDIYNTIIEKHKIDVVFKLSGRYLLNENFKLRFDKSALYFRIINTFNDPNNPALDNLNTDFCFVTCLFGFTPDNSGYICNCMDYVINSISFRGSDIEHHLYNYVCSVNKANNLCQLDNIGVSGQLSPSGIFIKY